MLRTVLYNFIAKSQNNAEKGNEWRERNIMPKKQTTAADEKNDEGRQPMPFSVTRSKPMPYGIFRFRVHSAKGGTQCKGWFSAPRLVQSVEVGTQ
jgi:hypothetical protein